MAEDGLKVLEEFRKYKYYVVSIWGTQEVAEVPTGMTFCADCGRKLTWEKQKESFDGDTGDFLVYEQLRCNRQVKKSGFWFWAKYQDCQHTPLLRVHSVKKSK